MFKVNHKDNRKTISLMYNKLYMLFQYLNDLKHALCRRQVIDR